MRTIHLEENLRLRFPGRDDEFADGVEIGMIATLLTLGQTEITRALAPSSAEQAEVLARKLGYHLAEQHQVGDVVHVTLRFGRSRPKLTLVHSRRDDPAREAAG